MTIRFEVSPPGGPPHEAELAGPVAVLGRDPSCDLVLGDTKCSRRHAIVEEGPDGLVIRDAGSANGIHVNGARRESSPLRPGDNVRIGETTLRVLDEVAETVVLAPHDLEVPGEPYAAPGPGHQVRSPVPPRRPRPALEPARARPEERPLTLRLLSLLWALAAPAWMIASLLVAVRSGVGPLAALAAGSGLALGGLSVAVALGLRSYAPWAWRLQVAAAAGGLLVCPFAFAAATVLVYMLRTDVRAAFEGGRPRGALGGAGTADATFALSLVGTLALGLAMSAAAVVALRGR